MAMTVKPLAPYSDRPADASRDFAGAGAFSLHALERMLRDCAEQPDWRLRAKLCAAYYDGKQLSELQRWNIRQEDLEERAINLIRPVINSVLGQEARSRTDVKLEADDDEYADVAEVLSVRLKEAERETRAHMAISNGYSSGVKKGLGWAHVCRNSDPLAYRYRFEDVPIDEIWWDWRGQRGTVLDDRCRWLVRMRMQDLDELEAAFPDKREILQRSINGWADYVNTEGNLLGEPESIDMTEAWENQRSFSVSMTRFDWIDTARKMVKVYEVWYRVPAVAVILHVSPIKRVVYNENDPRHVEAVSRGLVKISKGITSQVRRALYAGPHRLLDEATTRRRFPYIPFFAFRDDSDASPYGLIDGMVAPQDEYNERRLRIQWMLKARQIQMDSDALDTEYNTIEDIADAVMRPDMVAITNPNRTNKNQAAITIKNDLSMQKEQFEVMGDSKELIQHTAGRFNSQLGNAQVQSGIANSLLIEQGEQSMGEMNDNYVTFRRTAFEQLVDLISEDMSAPQIRVPIGTGKARRVVVLNTWETPTQPAVDPNTGQPALDAQGAPVMVAAGPPQPKNMVADAEVRTALAEAPNTPAYRMQTQDQIAKIIQAVSANPKATAILTPAYIESTSLPNRQQVADDLRKISGLPQPGDKEGQARADAMQQQVLQKELQNKDAKEEAEVVEHQTAAERNRAQARQATASATLIEQRVAANIEVEQGRADLVDTITHAELNIAQARKAAGEVDEDQLIQQALQEASQLQPV
jgi:hypothetical protein